jgi:hypothetical protein
MTPYLDEFGDRLCRSAVGEEASGKFGLSRRTIDADLDHLVEQSPIC